ncbi:hypothetical protein [Puniceibacterium sediminis]|uniref:Lipoprotein n=1 Tax=Puniceibacterium sediminis TaxID=1608407 RepID=A0A238VJW1_9RHOB|nr:hypothetical protein [Puniceibacterium sediminis]SNR34516.1 hypothetical protein SAMN06265370_102276 [Puniceibacterium sediminis]
MRLRACVLVLGAGFALAGCASNTSPIDAAPDVVARSVYRHDGPPSLTLFTMVSNSSGAGAHSSIMVNASQRVIFDPAGSVRHSAVPEVRDVLYGITPRIEKFYESAHARTTYHVVIQEVAVSAAVAEKALELVQARGPVGQMYCAQSTSSILNDLPGFEGIRTTFFPNGLAKQFGRLPDVTTRVLYEDDDDDKRVAIEQFNAAQEEARVAAQTRNQNQLSR